MLLVERPHHVPRGGQVQMVMDFSRRKCRHVWRRVCNCICTSVGRAGLTWGVVEGGRTFIWEYVCARTYVICP